MGDLFSSSECNEILLGCMRRMPVYLCRVPETRNQKKAAQSSQVQCLISRGKGGPHLLSGVEEAPPSPLLGQSWGRRKLNLVLINGQLSRLPREPG